MKNKPLTISDEAKVQMPMKTVASLIMMVELEPGHTSVFTKPLINTAQK